MLAIWAASSSARATTAFCGRSAMTRCRGGRLVENIRPWAINPWPTTKATHGAMNPATPSATGWTFVPSSQGAGQVAPGRGRADRDARPLSIRSGQAPARADRLPKGHWAAANHSGRGAGTGAVPSLIPPYELDRDGPTTAERVPAPEPADSSGPHQPSDGAQGGSGAGAVPKVRRTMTKATPTMAAASPET